MFGRTKIFTDETEITKSNIVAILQAAYSVHEKNSGEIDYLYNYYKGNQPILGRVKQIRPEINNKIVENRANEIVSFKVGYLCGEPIQCVSRGMTDEISEAISKLNDMLLLCDKSTKDKDLAEWMYIAGHGYRMVRPNGKYILRDIVPRLMNRRTEFAEDESPFDIYILDPRYTFCVYSSALGEPCLMGVKYIVRSDGTAIFSVYTTDQYYEIESGEVVKTDLNRIGEIPIIEYPLNNARLGAFEIVLPILDAINTVQSNRIDGVEQFIQSLIVLTNAEVDDKKANQLREAGLITLKSFGENKAELKILSEQLNQTQTQTLIDYLYQTVLNIVGMPNRNGGSSTSDTGAAVHLRDGFESAESRAKSDELMFKGSERRFLKIALRIVRATVGTPLKLSDIENKFTRRNYENILSKSQVLTSMLANDKIAPALAFTYCGMFSDPEEAARMSAKHYADVMAAMERELNV